MVEYFQAVPADEFEKLIAFDGHPLSFAQLRAGEMAVRNNKKYYVVKVLWEVEPAPNTACTPTGGGLVQADDESTLPATSG